MALGQISSPPNSVINLIPNPTPSFCSCPTVTRAWQSASLTTASERERIIACRTRYVPLSLFHMPRISKSSSPTPLLTSPQVPGLYACTNDVAKPNETTVPDYISFTGVPTIASEPSTTWRYDVLTPYAAFPVVLANKSVGMVWYLNTLQGPR